MIALLAAAAYWSLGAYIFFQTPRVYPLVLLCFLAGVADIIIFLAFSF